MHHLLAAGSGGGCSGALSCGLSRLLRLLLYLHVADTEGAPRTAGIRMAQPRGIVSVAMEEIGTMCAIHLRNVVAPPGVEPPALGLCSSAVSSSLPKSYSRLIRARTCSR